MRVRTRRHRGQLLVELGVAVAVAIAGIAAALARAQSTAKTGREVELMNHMIEDATNFAGWANNLHQMGGPNYVANTSSTGNLTQEYGEFLQRNYPINNVTFQAPAGAAAGFSGFVYLNASLGTQSAIGGHGTPFPGGQFLYVNGANYLNPSGTNANIVQVAYFIVQTAPLAVENGIGGGGLPPDFPYTVAANTAPAAASGTNQNSSSVSEGAGVALAEDPNTGLVAIVAPFAFGSADFQLTPPAPGVPFPFFPYFPDVGSQGINIFPQPNNF